MRGCSALLAVAALAACASWSAGCRKSAVMLPMRWHVDVDAAVDLARTQQKPLVVLFGASWDTAWKELETVTLADPEVRALLGRRFVTVYVDATDDEDPRTRFLQERFRVIGDPTVIVLGPDGTSEIARYNAFVPPARMVAVLRAALRPDAVREARFEAAARARAEQRRDEEERRRVLETNPAPTVTITLGPE